MDPEASSKRCIYVIAKGKSIKDLQKNVNEMIEQGWQSESGLIIRGWEPVGGITFDGKWYLQSMIHCQ